LRYILLAEVPAEERAAAQGLLTISISVGQLLCGVLVAVMAAASLGLVNRRPA